MRQGVQTITDLIAVPAMINLDFADVRSVMEGQGSALIGIGISQGDNKAQEAAQKAIQSPLLEAQINGAKKGDRQRHRRREHFDLRRERRGRIHPGSGRQRHRHHLRRSDQREDRGIDHRDSHRHRL